MKRSVTFFWILAVIFTLLSPVCVNAEDNPGELYALSAVLMDGETGRVLYEKEGTKMRPMASTTKVMTCILALEHASGDEIVKITDEAVLQPEVKLYVKKGESYRMQDLLYAMMMKSYNDVAVAIAVHISGSVKKFAELMNEKAKILGCQNTNFVTPNGLDGMDDNGKKHMTTAEDLALIMRYAITNPVFLDITRMQEYAFQDIDKTRSFTVTNGNAYLNMREGMISGKTGFTGNAGYCYVGACEQKGRVYIVALLGCGWPNNKTYKWRDMDKLLNYGEDKYQLEKYYFSPKLPEIEVEEGIPEKGNLKEKAITKLVLKIPEEEKEKKVLMKEGENVSVFLQLNDHVQAPISQGQKLGQITYTLNGFPLAVYDVVAEKKVEKLTFQWCVQTVCYDFFHGCENLFKT